MASHDKDDFSSAINQFATKFHYVNHSQGKPGSCGCGGKRPNSVSSGLSAELVLALLTLGTEGETHHELLAAMNVPDDDALRNNFAEVSAKLKGAKGITLSIANKVYVKDGSYQLKPEFKEDAENVFGAEVEKCNFANSAAAASTINSWVSDKTNHKIQDLLTPDSFNDGTMAVLVNALYFKGFWAKKFDPQDTFEEDFYVTKETKVPVSMMHTTRHFNYAVCDVLDSQLLEMKYEGDEASLLIVLPNRIDGLQKLMSQISQNPALIDIPLRKTKVEVAIPKFRIESELDLKTLLPKMGISKIFDPNNEDITKIVDPPAALFVSKAVQKAFIEINEEGAEAAAATAAVMMMRCAMRNPVFRANQPFFYTLRVKDHHLFVGTFEGEK